MKSMYPLDAKLSLVFLCVLALTGCESKPAAKDGKISGIAPVSAGEVKLEEVTFAEWEFALKAQQGKIVVVDTWATWCEPCREEFPELVKVHERHSKDGVVCMSVSLDHSKDRANAIAFLKEKGAAFPNYLMEKEGQPWLDKWQIEAVPAVLVFDRTGKLARKFGYPDDYGDVENLVQQLIRTK